jgi:hypothetical protein
VFDGKRIAKRSSLGTPRADTWASIERGFQAAVDGAELIVMHDTAATRDEPLSFLRCINRALPPQKHGTSLPAAWARPFASLNLLRPWEPRPLYSDQRWITPSASTILLFQATNHAVRCLLLHRPSEGTAQRCACSRLLSACRSPRCDTRATRSLIICGAVPCKGSECEFVMTANSGPV